ncbi:MAG TPA: tetratricopeptide repeat protein [Streptosporangiaceae bacterium]
MTTSPPGAASGDPPDGSQVVMRGESRDSSTFTQIATQIVQPPLPPPLEVRCSLPPDTAAFTGRDEELHRITAVADAAGAGGVVAVCAIDGMPGVGKTALAVHVAHLLRHRFPDRQLFIDLHSHTPGQDPVSPGAALAGLLTAVGVDARNLPRDTPGRAGLWRDRMAGQQALLVLDNAASSGQVTPLLPGDEGCLVLVTSRRHLGDLPGAAAAVLLEALPPGNAQEMFLRLAPRAATATAAAAAELVRLAGYLPLAISLLARVYARHRSWTLADLTGETKASLLTLTAEKNSIAAAFEVSYRYLAPSQQRFFRCLGLHPGTTIEAYAAAALAGTGLQEAAGHLDALHGEGLLTEAGYRRYGLHDLIRRYARDRATADAAHGHGQELERLLDYYQHTGTLAEIRLARQTRTSSAPAALVAPAAAVPSLPDSTRALAWARAEHANLLACLDHVTGTGQHARVIALTAAMATVLRRDSPWADAITRHATAVQAARRLGDRLGEATALNDLGDVRLLTDDYPRAAEALEAALGIFGDLGNRLGQVRALTSLGAVRRLTGDYPRAAEALEAALGISRDLGNQLGQTNALTGLGAVRRLTGDYPGAAEALEAALGISRDLGDQLGQASALTGLGAVRQLTGDHPGAAEALEAALGIYRSTGYRHGEAEVLNEVGALNRIRGDLDQAGASHRQARDLAREIAISVEEARALAGLGRCAQAAGHTADAEASLRQAQEIFQRIGATEAAGGAAELDALSGTGPAT